MPPTTGAEPPNPAEAPQVGETATGVVASIVDYLHARLELLAFEAKDAKGDLIVRLACVGVGLFFLLIGYLALCVFLVGWLISAAGWTWPMAALALGGVHLLTGLILFVVAKRRFSAQPFRDTMREWEKDREWLHQHRKNPPSR